MAKKIQAYVDAPVREHHDLHTGGIAYVVHAPYIDEEVRCVTLVDHQSDKHERVYTESEVKAMIAAILREAEQVPSVNGGFIDIIFPSNVRGAIKEQGIVLDPA